MFVLSLALPLLTGFLIISCLCSDQGPFFSTLFSIKSSFAVGLGLGISSHLFFVCLLLFGSPNIFSVVTEMLVLTCLIAFSLYLIMNRNNKNRIFEQNHSALSKKPYSFLLSGFWIAFILSASFFILISLNNYHGSWDAWAIWNMRARFIFRGGDKWVEAFSNIYGWSHPDYPLLIPLNIARIWNYMGSETPIVPVSIAFLFTFSTVALTASSISYIRSHSQGFLAGLVLLGITSFTCYGAQQCADVPFGFYVLATLVSFFLHDKIPERSLQLIFLSGIMAGFSAWTKNEGFLLIISVIIAHFIIVVPLKGWKTYAAEIVSFMAGLFPILIIIAYFKIQLAPPNDLFSGQGVKFTIDRLADFSRYLIVGKSFITTFFEIIKGRIIIFPICLLFLGLSYPEQYKISIYISSIVLLLMLMGYFMVYIISPHDLVWHLSSSLERLFLQLLPSAIFIFFVLLTTPEEMQMNKSNG